MIQDSLKQTSWGHENGDNENINNNFIYDSIPRDILKLSNKNM